jgi:hypothetical protein
MSGLQKTAQLAGMTKHNCPAACTVDSCVIAAGRPFCFHPCGSGVPFNFKGDPAVQKVYAEACAALGISNKNEIES